MRDEYDFSKGARGKYAGRYAEMIEIDLSKVKTSHYLDFLANLDTRPNQAVSVLLSALDPAIEGGTLERPMTEIPAILAQVMKVLVEFNTDVNLAIASMSEYLKGGQE